MLILNNTSRLIRAQFQSEDNNFQKPMAHIYKIKNDYNTNPYFTSSTVDSTEDGEASQARRVKKIFEIILNHTFSNIK